MICSVLSLLAAQTVIRWLSFTPSVLHNLADDLGQNASGWNRLSEGQAYTSSRCSIAPHLVLLMQLLLEAVPVGHSLPMLCVEGLQGSKARRIVREQHTASPCWQLTAHAALDDVSHDFI